VDPFDATMFVGVGAGLALQVATEARSSSTSPPMHSRSPLRVPTRRETLGLGLLFGLMYFVQGLTEPTEGLIAQPLRTMLSSWGWEAGAIASFAAVLALPWSFKPLYGVLSDFVPIFGSRRRVYLILTSAAAVAGFAWIYVSPLRREDETALLLLLLLPTIGVAFADVVVDALMVEKGKPLGLTGRLQSIQWASIWTATILTGWIGGYLSRTRQESVGFLICAIATLLTLVAAICFVREAPMRVEGKARDATRLLGQVVRSPTVIGASAFLFLWNFNPFNTTVLHLHATKNVGIDEEDYGKSISLLAVGSVAASVAYGFYCRSVSFRRLIHFSIALGIVSTLAYVWLDGVWSLWSISVFVGLTYTTGSMIQLDLAARSSPEAAAGTTFALLMAVSNLGVSGSTVVGGWLYEKWTRSMTPEQAFERLVVAGAIATAASWIVVPFLVRSVHGQSPSHGQDPIEHPTPSAGSDSS
jgi:hypothetical protein